MKPSEMQATIKFPVPSYRDAKKGLERKGILVFNGDKTFEFRPFAVLDEKDLE